MLQSRFVLILALSTAATFPVLAQTAAVSPVAATATTAVPMLVRHSGIAVRIDGKPQTGETSISFLVFKEEKGGEPLWVETQSVAVDATGHYEVHLGAMGPSGLPSDLFGTGEARWLEVQVAGGAPQPRVLLASVPYAMNAATLGGLPASAFVLAGRQLAVSAAGTVAGATAATVAGTPDSSATVTTTGGTTSYLPLFTGTSEVASSEIYDTGTSVGIGDKPNATARLDVNGGIIVRGDTTVSRTGNATASTSYPSYGFDFFSNAYNSSTKATDNPHFQLQSEPTGNNTSNTGATFNLLYSNHGSTPAETGLSINSSGTINFASGQVFNSGITSGDGVQGDTTGSTDGTAGVYGVAGTASGTTGTAGVWGDSSAGVGVYGTSASATGIVGQSATRTGILGISRGASNTGATYQNDRYAAGTWGDIGGAESNSNDLGGIVGSADDNVAGFFVNYSADSPAVEVANNEGGPTGLFKTLEAVTPDGACGFGGKGDMTCTGQVKTLATTSDGAKTIETYSVQSTESWFEDAGTVQLMRGTAHVNLEPVFGQTVNTGVEYHVFLTPDGDCKGLYVSAKSANGFDVHEVGGGTSSISFEYRIMAKRIGHEQERLVDVTGQMKKVAVTHARLSVARRDSRSVAPKQAAAEKFAISR